MKCAIMQPTYFPWAGYFNLISQVDYFVFLDDAQFQKGTWHNRNKLLVNKQPAWMTIPVLRECLEQKICESKLDDKKTWRRKHVNLIQQNYSKHPYYLAIVPFIEMIEDTSLNTLSELNINIIKKISAALGLQKNFVLSSALDIQGERSERLVKICKKLECEEYISPPGAKDYLEEDGFTQLSNMKLTINNFNPKVYPQAKSDEFISHFSILDVMANIGLEKTREYIS